MNIQKAKDFFAVGAISEVSTARAPMDDGWIIAFRLTAGKGDILETALGDPKVFSSLDTLFGQVVQITGRPVRHAVFGV
jgi:hypothetical protein